MSGTVAAEQPATRRIVEAVLQGQARFLIIRGPPPAGATRGFAQMRQYRLPDGEALTLFERQ